MSGLGDWGYDWDDEYMAQHYPDSISNGTPYAVWSVRTVPVPVDHPLAKSIQKWRKKIEKERRKR